MFQQEFNSPLDFYRTLRSSLNCNYQTLLYFSGSLWKWNQLFLTATSKYFSIISLNDGKTIILAQFSILWHHAKGGCKVGGEWLASRSNWIGGPPQAQKRGWGGGELSRAKCKIECLVENWGSCSYTEVKICHYISSEISAENAFWSWILISEWNKSKTNARGPG